MMGAESVVEAWGPAQVAERHYRQTVRSRPADAEAWFHLGRLLLERGEMTEAEDCWRSATKAAPHYAEAWFHLGRLLLERGKATEAEDCWCSAVKAAPHYAEAWFHLGRRLLERGETAEAEACWRSAVAATPHYAEAWDGLGQRLEARGAVVEALDAYERAHAAAGHYVDPWRRALSLIEQQRLTDHPLRTALLDRIDAHLTAAGLEAARGQPRLVWYFARIERAGHLAHDIQFVKMLFASAFPEIVMLCRPRRHAANAALFEIMTRGLTVVEIEDPQLDNLARGGRLVFQRGDTTYLPYTTGLDFDCFVKLRQGHPPYLARLSEEDEQRGRTLARRAGIGDPERIVVLHARERGFQEKVANPNASGTLAENASLFRNMQIESYLPAIRFLVEEGYVVVRIGDRHMTPLPDLGPRVIDLPFHPDYDPLLEVWCTATCVFMLGTSSGPAAWAALFGRPVMAVNMEYAGLHATLQCAAFRCMFKKFYRATPQGREYLSFRRLIEAELADSFYESDIHQLGLSYEDNSPEEIVAACREMIDLVNNPEAPPSPEHAAWTAVLEEENRKRANDGRGRRELPLFGLPHILVSTSFCRLNPWLLDDGKANTPLL